MLASLNLISAALPSFKGGLLQPPYCSQGSRCVWCVLQGNTQTELRTCMYVDQRPISSVVTDSMLKFRTASSHHNLIQQSQAHTSMYIRVCTHNTYPSAFSSCLHQVFSSVSFLAQQLSLYTLSSRHPWCTFVSRDNGGSDSVRFYQTSA